MWAGNGKQEFYSWYDLNTLIKFGVAAHMHLHVHGVHAYSASTGQVFIVFTESGLYCSLMSDVIQC